MLAFQVCKRSCEMVAYFSRLAKQSHYISRRLLTAFDTDTSVNYMTRLEFERFNLSHNHSKAKLENMKAHCIEAGIGDTNTRNDSNDIATIWDQIQPAHPNA